ncbi:unnamed protein product, partial [Gulo gulo]
DIELERFSSNEHSRPRPLVSQNQARGPKPCPPGEPGARRSEPIVRSSDPRAGSTARARSSNSALGAAFVSPLFSVPSFSPGRKWLPFSPLTVVFDPGVFGAHCLGCFSVCTFRGSGALCRPLPSGPLRGPRLPHTLGWPISAPGRARHNGALAASPPEPASAVPPRRAPLPAPSSRRGGVLRGNRPAGALTPDLGLLGARYRAERGPSKPTPRAPVGRELCTRACGALHPAPRRPRPGRAARGFHGDGKQASTASATTAKFPAFHPPLGAQRDDRGAGCEERERGDSDPEVRGGTGSGSEAEGLTTGTDRELGPWVWGQWD